MMVIQVAYVSRVKRSLFWASRAAADDDNDDEDGDVVGAEGLGSVIHGRET